MHTHLIYKLEFPSTEGEAAEQQPQEALKVAQEASFLLQIENPTQKERNEFRGLKRKRKPVFPKHLQERFGKLRYHGELHTHLIFINWISPSSEGEAKNAENNSSQGVCIGCPGGGLICRSVSWDCVRWRWGSSGALESY
ncbi:hypothetical protein Tco_0413550 [Tanacetum coccineum]